MAKFHIKLTFTEPLLGTRPGEPELVAKWIASKAPDVALTTEEVAVATEQALDKQLELATCVFPDDGTGPFLFDYQFKGFCKSAAENLRRFDEGEYHSSALKASRKLIDGGVHAMPRRIMLHLPDGQELGICERPLRAMTAQGERVALARSQMAPAGTWCEFDLIVMDTRLADCVEEWLDYGALVGMGAWRNSGMGRFSHELTVVTAPVKRNKAVKE